MPLRSHQQQIKLAAPTLLEEGTPDVLLECVPRGGKEACAYLLADNLPEVRYWLWITPRDSLRTQGGEPPKDWLRPYLKRNIEFRAAGNELDPRRGHAGYVTTYQAIREDPRLHFDEFKRFRGEYGLILDEPHHVEAGSDWETALRPLVEMARVRLYMSGTLFRHNGKKIAFLPYKDTATGTDVDTKAAGWLYIAYKRSKAIEEHAILPLECERINAWAQCTDSDGSRKKWDSIKEITDEDEARTAIFTVVNVRAAEEILVKGLQHWLETRKYNPRAQCLIVAPWQRLARKYLDEARRLVSDEHIAMVATTDEGSVARDRLRDFRAGRIAILSTVGMAYEGMDAPSVTHVILLTHIRSLPWLEQALSRATTIDPDAPQKRKGIVFAPDDLLLQQILEKIEKEQGTPIKLQESKNSGGGGGPHGVVLPEDGGTLGTTAHELSGVELSEEETRHMQMVAGEYGIPHVSPVDMLKMMNRMMDIPETVTRSSDGSRLGPKEREAKLRDEIQTRCSNLDYKRGVAQGTTNSEVVFAFGKSRTVMREHELRRVWGWLNQHYSKWQTTKM